MLVRTYFREARWLVLGVFLFSLAGASCSAATLDDLKKLEIICFVPSYLPKGLKLKSCDITYDEIQEYEDKNRPLPLYSLVYEGPDGMKFWIDSAREGIGDRNVMEEEDTEDSEIQSPLGQMFIIYRPKGKTGRKIEIDSNWMRDANMVAETDTQHLAHPVLGRFHGFSASGISPDEFSKVVHSLRPVSAIGEKAAQGSAPAASLKIHPKVFNLIDCWISDSESPVVTEINLDAVEKNGNEFNDDGLKQDGQWTRCPLPDTNGFIRYRVLESKGNRYKVEYQENGGGTLTTASIIEFAIEKREIRRDGKQATIRVLHVLSHASKSGD